MGIEKLPLWEEQEFLEVRGAESWFSPQNMESGAKSIIETMKASQRPSPLSFKPQATQFLFISPRGTTHIDLLVKPRDANQFDNLKSVLKKSYPDKFSIFKSTGSLGNRLNIPQPDTHSESKSPLANHHVSATRIEPAGDDKYFWRTKYSTLDVENSDGTASPPLHHLLRKMSNTSEGVMAEILVTPQFLLKRLHNNTIEEFESTLDSKEDSQNNILDIFEEPKFQLSNRLDSLKEKDVGTLIETSVRVFEFGEDEKVTQEWETPFHSFTNSWVSPSAVHLEGKDARKELERTLQFRPHRESSVLNRMREQLGYYTNRESFILDHEELARLLAINPNSLADSVHRGLQVQHEDRTPLRLPPEGLLEKYTGPGMHLGHIPDEKGDLDAEIALPRGLLNKHTLITGSTGSGKSIAGVKAILSGHEVTDGATIVFAPKGGDFVDTLLRARMKQAGSLDDVRLYDLNETLPGLSFFDIRRDLDAGRMRSTAVSSLVNQYTSIGVDIMGERYTDAEYAVRLIRLLIRALFDREYGNDAFTHQKLVRSARRLSDGEIPPVDDPQLREQLTAATEHQQRTLDNIVTGMTNRLSAVTENSELRAMLNHIPDQVEEGFSFDEILDENTIIVFDLEKLAEDIQDAVTVLLMSELWAALNRRRTRKSGDLKQTLLHLEETASLTGTDLLDTFLSQGREFGIGVTVSTQFPKQFADSEQGSYRSYLEVLNNVGTTLTANVNVDEKFVQRFADSRENFEEISNRLRNLPPGEWLLSLPGHFGKEKPRPFEVKAGPLPPGHPKGPHPLSEQESLKFEEERNEIRLSPGDEMAMGSVSDIDDSSPAGENKPAQSHHRADHIETTLTATSRLPECVSRELEIPAVTCDECGKRYALSMRGLQEAVTCHHSLEDIDRDNFPVVETHLTLSAEERKQSDLSLAQLRFLQMVENVRRRRYSPLEYDIVYDSMMLLRDYAGIGLPAVEELIEADLLRKNVDHPHLIYSTTPDGREVIGESARRGRDFGRGEGDFGEQNHHVFMVEVAVRYLEENYMEDSQNDVESVESYYATNGRVFDVVGLDEHDEIRIVVEAERITGSLYSDAPDDYEKIAAVEPDDAIWIMPNREDGHKILTVLGKKTAAEGIGEEYAETTPLGQRHYDGPGLTAAYSVSKLRGKLSQR